VVLFLSSTTTDHPAVKPRFAKGGKIVKQRLILAKREGFAIPSLF
jgi:hypothetical protein